MEVAQALVGHGLLFAGSEVDDPLLLATLGADQAAVFGDAAVDQGGVVERLGELLALGIEDAALAIDLVDDEFVGTVGVDVVETRRLDFLALAVDHAVLAIADEAIEVGGEQRQGFADIVAQHLAVLRLDQVPALLARRHQGALVGAGDDIVVVVVERHEQLGVLVDHRALAVEA